MTRVTRRPNFERLRRDVRIEAVCESLHIELKRMGKQLRGQCPLCGHRSERAFVVTPAMRRFWCFADRKAGGRCARPLRAGKADDALPGRLRVAADLWITWLPEVGAHRVPCYEPVLDLSGRSHLRPPLPGGLSFSRECYLPHQAASSRFGPARLRSCRTVTGFVCCII